tara:strand:- start:1997 stop:2194 length:198 start_codon:yes stop_codon:yes gene_type:complete
MNERIKDLAEQAGLEMYTSQATKFVELLIQESIEVMVEHDYHGEWLGEKLKEHFGTKERVCFLNI